MPEGLSLARVRRPWPMLVVAVGATLALARSAGAEGIDKQNYNQIERGRYLAVVGDCAACHTLPGSGHDFAGGRAIETPFGMLVAPNITPDPFTGIGAWTDDEFVNALTKGTGRHGDRLYPAMPYTYYTKLSHDDVLAIRAYLNTVPAVQNAVKSNQLPFPLNIRTGMMVWDQLFFTPGAFKPDPAKSAELNRGAYLVEGPGHCGMCHTPKNFLGGDKTSERLEGYKLQGWFAPNITNDDRRGVGSWSVEQIAAYLKMGANEFTTGNGLMSETIHLSTSHMRDDDVRAIALYLKDQPSQSVSSRGDTPDQAAMKAGAQIYADECSGCHGPAGKGTPGLFPSLNGTPMVQQADATTLIRVVLRGAQSVATKAAPTGPEMPAFGWILNDDQVADVLTYIRNSWGNSASAVDAATIRKQRQALVERSD
jgi:mono/diheme cytochrome c family protein